jgi:hypothetical protein
MAYSFEPSHEYFQKMDGLQSMIEKELQKKAHELSKIDSLILSKFMEFQKQNQQLRQDRRNIEILANSKIHNIQCEMDLCERERISVLENEARQDIREEELDEEFEEVPTFSTKKRVKKAKSVDKSVNKKFVLNILHSNSKTTDKLPRFVMEKMIHCHAKPKYKNSH